MFFNWLVFPTLAAALGLYALGRLLAGRRSRARLALLVALCAPGASFLLYYLHVVREPAWYVEWRAIPGIELLSAFWGLLAGYLEPPGGVRYFGPRPVLRLSLLLAFVPFAKPVLLPVAWGERFTDRWENGVCLQSTMATCGPSSLAGVFRVLGVRRTEEEIARGAFSGRTGTENWYLLRYARRHGLSAGLRQGLSLSEVRAPAILGVKVAVNAGHFVVLLGRENGRMVVGDPLSGRILLDEPAFAELYAFTGTAMEFSRP